MIQHSSIRKPRLSKVFDREARDLLIRPTPPLGVFSQQLAARGLYPRGSSSKTLGGGRVGGDNPDASLPARSDVVCEEPFGRSGGQRRNRTDPSLTQRTPISDATNGALHQICRYFPSSADIRNELNVTSRRNRSGISVRDIGLDLI